MAATGTITTTHKVLLAEIMGGVYGDATTPDAAKTGLPITDWAVGEGGFQVVGSSKFPKVPSPALTDTEANIAPAPVGAAPTSATGLRFTGVFGPGDVTVVGGTITATITLAAATYGLDNNSKLNGNLGNPPQLFEAMLFDGNGNAVAYFTYDQVVKLAANTVVLTLTVTY
jgi:hypothetical protein